MVNENLVDVADTPQERHGNTFMLSTIGYESADLSDFIATLKLGGVEVLVDIRDRAQSRRRGFSKTALSDTLANSGIEYRHYRDLGDPKEGREAARAGQYERFKMIFSEVMKSNTAQDALRELSSIARSRMICLMCYERDQKVCHRKMVAEHLEKMLDCRTNHLGVRKGVARESADGRMRHINQSAAPSLQQVL